MQYKASATFSLLGLVHIRVSSQFFRWRNKIKYIRWLVVYQKIWCQGESRCRYKAFNSCLQSVSIFLLDQYFSAKYVKLFFTENIITFLSICLSSCSWKNSCISSYFFKKNPYSSREVLTYLPANICINRWIVCIIIANDW